MAAEAKVGREQAMNALKANTKNTVMVMMRRMKRLLNAGNISNQIGVRSRQQSSLEG
jgi:hypothetical protein